MSRVDGLIATLQGAHGRGSAAGDDLHALVDAQNAAAQRAGSHQSKTVHDENTVERQIETLSCGSFHREGGEVGKRGPQGVHTLPVQRGGRDDRGGLEKAAANESADIFDHGVQRFGRDHIDFVDDDHAAAQI